METSSSSTKKRAKLSVRNRTSFKKTSISSSSILMRRKTILTKAYELSTLCEIDLCVISYGRDGELTTWPEDQTKVRDMAERFSKLSEKERRKKSTNLSEHLRKKFIDEQKASLKNKDNTFSEKISEMENSLKSKLGMFQNRLQRLNPNNDPIEIRADPSPSLVVDEPLMNPSPPSTEPWCLSSSSSLNQPSNFSLLMYNHDNGTFTKVADLDQPSNNLASGYYDYSNLLLGGQGFGGLTSCNNFDLPSMVIPPQMQTQNSLLNFGQNNAAWNHQTPYFGNPMMFSSNYV